MSNEMLKYGLIAVAGLFAIVVIAYIILMKRMNKKDVKQAMALKAGVESNRTINGYNLSKAIYVLH